MRTLASRVGSWRRKGPIFCTAIDLRLWNQQAGTGKDLTRKKEWEFELLFRVT